MSRLGSVALVLALSASFAAVARAQDNSDSDAPVGATPKVVSTPGATKPTVGTSPDATIPPLELPATKTPASNLPAMPAPLPGAPVAKTTPAAPAPVSTTTASGMVNVIPNNITPYPGVVTKAPAPKTDPNALANNPYAGYGGYYGGGAPPQGGGSGGGSRNQGPNTELKFPDEGSAAGAGKADVAKGGAPGAGASSSGGAAGGSSPSPVASSRERDDAPGLPSPSSRGSQPAATPPAPKKSYLEGHVVLFLRAPGDEDPSPAGVKARSTKEAKVVQRIAADVQKGEKPATKPEEAVLRDAAPQGFYLPDEVDAWLVTSEGTLVLLEAEGQTFDKVAALALSAKLNVTGPQGEVTLDSGTFTKVKVIAMTTDGSEPRIDGGASFGGGAKPQD